MKTFEIKLYEYFLSSKESYLRVLEHKNRQKMTLIQIFKMHSSRQGPNHLIINN